MAPWLMCPRASCRDLARRRREVAMRGLHQPTSLARRRTTNSSNLSSRWDMRPHFPSPTIVSAVLRNPPLLTTRPRTSTIRCAAIPSRTTAHTHQTIRRRLAYLQWTVTAPLLHPRAASRGSLRARPRYTRRRRTTIPIHHRRPTRILLRVLIRSVEDPRSPTTSSATSAFRSRRGEIPG